MIKTVYVVADCCRGEDYSTDEPNILLITINYEEAKQFFQDEISNWEDGMTFYDSNVEEYEDNKLVYDCTDYRHHTHRIMKLTKCDLVS